MARKHFFPLSMFSMVCEFCVLFFFFFFLEDKVLQCEQEVHISI